MSRDAPRHERDVAELVSLARGIVSGKKDVLADIRQMKALIYGISYDREKEFLPIIGIDSETDTYPLGNVRAQYAPAFLARLDTELDEYLLRTRDVLIETCKCIILKFATDAEDQS